MEENTLETPVTDDSTAPAAETTEAGEATAAAEKPAGRRAPRGDRGDRGDKRDKPKKEFDEILLEVRRVTRVNTGGRQLSFRAIILVGNKKGKIGLGISKGADVAIAVRKATHEAYKNIKVVPITEGGSVPYMLSYKYKSAMIRLIPASSGTGLKAGSALRSVAELAGYTNILSKIMGTNNKLNNALATIYALCSYKVDRASLPKHNTLETMQAKNNEKKDEERRPRRNNNGEGAAKKPASKAAPKKTA